MSDDEEPKEQPEQPDNEADDSDAGDEQELPPTEQRRRWRDDPLSVFLAASAVLLGVMYFVEQGDVAELQEAAVRAHQIGVAELDLEGCSVGSASTGGRLLVVDCAGSAEDAARKASELRPSLPGFERVLFVGSQGQLDCPVTPDDWPDNCEARPNPSRGDMLKAKRGRRPAG